MSDLPTPDDELLSSAIDGELTAETRARLDSRLAAEPALAARHAALTSAAALSATPVSPPAQVDRERVLAAALAASSTSPDVVDLRSRKTAGPWRTRVFAAAAAVALVAIAVPAIRAIQSDDTTDFSSEPTSADAPEDASSLDGATGGDLAPAMADDADEEMAGEAAMAEADMSGSAAADETATAADGDDAETVDESESADSYAFENAVTLDFLDDDLGEFANEAELQAAVRSTVLARSEGGDGATTTSVALPTTDTNFTGDSALDTRLRDQLGCPDPTAASGMLALLADAEIDPDQLTGVDIATASVAGERVGIVVVAFADDTAELFVLEPTDCTIRSSVAVG